MQYTQRNIIVEIADQPGIMPAGYKLLLHSNSDPIPDGLAVTEIRTQGSHRLTTGKFHREHVVQKIAYNRYRIKLFAQASDNINLIASANRLKITLKSEVVHYAEVVEFNQSNPEGMPLKQIDLVYIDTNEANYGDLEPVNNWLTTEALAAKIAAGTISSPTICRYRITYTVGILDIDESFYTHLAPVRDVSDVIQPEEDMISGLSKPNATNAQYAYRVVMYCNEATRRLIQQHCIINGGRSTAGHFLITGGITYVAVEQPTFDIQAIPEGSDLFRVDMTFKNLNEYIYNY